MKTYFIGYCLDRLNSTFINVRAQKNFANFKMELYDQRRNLKNRKNNKKKHKNLNKDDR
jgi:hypothetical protein